MYSVTAMALALLGLFMMPGDVEAAQHAWKLEQPHCGKPLYEWMTAKQRDELCEIDRSAARVTSASRLKIRTLLIAELKRDQ